MQESHKKGFSLIELLLVISVIVLLLGMLMPSLSAARERTRQVVCMAHLKDIGYGMQMYAMDYEDKFPDRYTLGGWGFRTAPGYKDPDDRRALPERFGLAAVLDDYNCIDGNSKIWLCPGQPYRWMRKMGNTYAFSTAKMLSDTKTTQMKRYSKTWLVWDNYTKLPYTTGQRAEGWEAGYSIADKIPEKDRKYPHSFEKRKRKGANILYADGHSAAHIDQ